MPYFVWRIAQYARAIYELLQERQRFSGRP